MCAGGFASGIIGTPMTQINRLADAYTGIRKDPGRTILKNIPSPVPLDFLAEEAGSSERSRNNDEAYQGGERRGGYQDDAARCSGRHHRDCDDLCAERLPLVITEKDGGKHMDGSLHYTGFAIDFRSWVVHVVKRPALLAQLKRELGSDWDVIEERDTSTPSISLRK